MLQEHLKSIREYEIARVLPYLSSDNRILEIGSGMGWQAKLMISHGLNVISLDTPENTAGWQHIIYDGKHIPLPEASIDVIYTSNVLEHIPHLTGFQQELRRVLKPGGRVIHVLPSSTWRWWTLCAFYLQKVYRLPHKFQRQKHNRQSIRILRNTTKIQFFPERHGTAGNSLTELYSFSRCYWVHFFCATGWTIERIMPNRLFYTGYSIFDSRMPMRVRHYLSYLAGSSCIIYVLR